MSLFAIPCMVVEDMGPFMALKKSVVLLKKSLGESFISYFSLGGAYFLFMTFGLVIGFPLVLFGFFIGAIVIGSYMLMGILFFGVINKIFYTALYLYADTGVVPDGFPPFMLASAYKPKKKKGLF